MKRSLIIVSLFALASTTGPLALAQQPTVLLQADGAKYEAAPFPAGAQQAVIVGNPTKAEGYVVRTKIPKGTKVPPHMHPNDENVTVVSGTFHIGTGEKFDEGKAQAVKAGGFFSIPKGLPHFGWVSEDTLIQLHGVGPAGRTFVNPADDPTKK
jgi:quercetin dioxygenase-like cupin family protein